LHFKVVLIQSPLPEHRTPNSSLGQSAGGAGVGVGDGVGFGPGPGAGIGTGPGGVGGDGIGVGEGSGSGPGAEKIRKAHCSPVQLLGQSHILVTLLHVPPFIHVVHVSLFIIEIIAETFAEEFIGKMVKIQSCKSEEG